MAEKTAFILGMLGADFMQMKTADNVYLKDIIADFSESLDLYNSKEQALTSIFCRKFEDESSTAKKLFTSDEFSDIGEIETPPDKKGVDVWNYPIPIRRKGASTRITLEQLLKMKSEDLLTFHNGKLLADKKMVVKEMFRAMCTKTPAGLVDALDGKATAPKAFWNADSADAPRTNGQNTFTTSHNHYLLPAGANDTFVDADIKAQLNTISEHEGMDGVQLVTFANTGTTLDYIKAISAFKQAYEVSSIIGLINPAYLQSGIAQALLTGGKILGMNVKVVGSIYNSIVVETADIPAKYILTVGFRQGANQAPLGWREHPQFKGLWLMEPTGANPLIGKSAQYRRYLGLGVEDRSAGACTYTGSGVSGGNAWAEPTFA